MYGPESPLSFWPFLSSSSWWWLISSVFLTKASCCKITHASGYYRAWPGKSGLVNGSPNKRLGRSVFVVANIKKI